MLFDELQKTWRSQKTARISVPPDVLLAELRRNQRSFKLTIFWRDFREVLAAIVVAGFFVYQGLTKDGWPWVLLGGICLCVGGFILVDRFRRRGRAARFGDSLLGCVNASLEDVEHQIWLLKNILWWYLLPPSIGIAIALIHMGMQPDDLPWLRWTAVAIAGAVCAIVYVGVYRLNQWAVQRHLEPRRQELLAVRESLMASDE